MQELGSIRRETETVIQDLKDVRNQNLSNKKKNAFNGLSRLDTAEERLSEPEPMPVESAKTELQREKKNKNEKDATESPKTVGWL